MLKCQNSRTKWSYFFPVNSHHHLTESFYAGLKVEHSSQLFLSIDFPVTSSDGLGLLAAPLQYKTFQGLIKKLHRFVKDYILPFTYKRGYFTPGL